MGDPKKPEVGDAVIDASELKLIDLNLLQIKKASKLHPGFEEALSAIQKASDDVKARTKIDAQELARILEVYANYLKAKSFVAPLAKLLELATETAIANGSEIAVFLTDTANAARTRHEREVEGKAPVGKEDIVAVLETLMKYQFGPAEQGAKTREENKEAKAEEPKKP